MNIVQNVKRYDNDFKLAIQKLNLVLIEDESPKNSNEMLTEFQNTIMTTAKIVEKLQYELEQK